MHSCFLDVFDGFSYEEAGKSADAVWHGTHVTDGIDAVRSRLLEYGANAPGLSIGVERCNIITDPLPASVLERGDGRKRPCTVDRAGDGSAAPESAHRGRSPRSAIPQPSS